MNLMVGAVALAAATNIEIGTDPIFAAIEQHRSAYQGHVASFSEDELEATIPKERRKSDIRDAVCGDEDWRVPTDDPAWIAHIEESLAAHEAETDASIGLVSSENLSRDGALALLRYAMEMEVKDSGCWPDELYDDNDKRRTWHFFLMEKIAGVLDKEITTA